MLQPPLPPGVPAGQGHGRLPHGRGAGLQQRQDDGGRQTPTGPQGEGTQGNPL